MTTKPRGSILVVEDNGDLRLSYRTILELAGWSVVEAADGREALSLAQEHRPDVAIVDISIPGLDGWQTTRLLKAARETSGIAVIAVTGHALDEDGERARNAGCDAYLVKPVEPRVLLDEVERLTSAE